MARTSRSRSPSISDRTLAIRTRDPVPQTLAIRNRDSLPQTLAIRTRDPVPQTLAIRNRDLLPQNATVTPVVGEFVSTQADRCPFPGCSNTLPHQHSPAEGEIAPSIEEYRKAAEAIRERWTEEQRRRIAENEALLRELAEIEPKVGGLSVKTHLPRGNDLTVPEQIAIIHHEAIPTPQVSDGASPSASRTEDESQTQAEQATRVEWDDFPELDYQYKTTPTDQMLLQIKREAVYGVPYHHQIAVFPEIDRQYETLPDEKPSNLIQYRYNAVHHNPRYQYHHQTTSSPEPDRQNETSQTHTIPRLYNPWTNVFDGKGNPIYQQPAHRLLDTDTQPCTGPCPIQTPHTTGPYLQRGGVPRFWNPRWGFSDPPRAVWEAWVRIKNGRGRSWDRVLVDGFVESHSWGGLKGEE